jgi:Spy/CpxP family protein refolding chaperone
MRKLITTIAFLALVGTSVAIAQRASSTNPDKQLLADAPVGHGQPRGDQVASDKMDPNGIMVLKGLTRPPRE